MRTSPLKTMARPLSTQIAAHLLPWKDGPWPAEWPRVFGREAPLALEVGFGNGAFLADLALERPDRDHVGVELSWTSVTHLMRRLEASGARNVRAMLGDARLALELLFAPDSLDAIYVNHPCPWPKARHEDRRLVDGRFLALAARRLKPDGELLIVTDHAAYAGWVHEAYAEQDAFVSRHETVEVDAIPGRTPTKYERKARAEGIPIHFFEWRRRAVDSAELPSAPPYPRPAPPPGPDPRMLSLTFHGPPTSAASCNAALASFRPRLAREEHDGVEVVVRLVGAYQRVGEVPENPNWIVETLVKEDELHQEFAIAVLSDRPGEVQVKLSSLGRALPTHGVKRALWEVGALLREEVADLTLAHENLGREVVDASHDHA